MLTKSFIADAVEFAGKTLTVSMRPFCLLAIQNLLERHGEAKFKYGVVSESSNEVNNVLTHVVELGTLKCMKDHNLIINNDNELLRRAVGIAYCINIDLGDIFKQLHIIDKNRLGYYNDDAIEILAQRVVANCKTHLNFNNLPKHIQADTFTIDEMFNFYLAEYLVK